MRSAQRKPPEVPKRSRVHLKTGKMPYLRRIRDRSDLVNAPQTELKTFIGKEKQSRCD